jgi:uncharacterized membrane protein YbhN (UPF0104 family)
MSMPKPEANKRAWIATALRVAGSAVVLGVLFHFLPLGPLREGLRRVPAGLFVATVAAYLAAHAIGIAKWHRMVNATGARLDPATAAQCYTGGLFGTLFLPSIVGGDVVRLAIGLRRSVRPSAVLIGNVADRLVDIAALGSLTILGGFLVPAVLPRGWHADFFRIVAWVAGFLFLVVLFAYLARSTEPLRGTPFRWRRRLVRVRQALGALAGRPGAVALAWLMGVAVQGSFVLLTMTLAKACGLELPLHVWLFAWPLAKLAALLPVTQGGIGVREAALVGLLTPFGAAPSLVLAAGLVWEGVIITGGLAAGAASLLLRRAVSRSSQESKP